MQNIVNQDNICSILLAGENSKVEFKTTVKNTYKHLSKIISAFANTDGGVVIFGYDEIHQSVIGTSTDDFEMVKKIIFTNKLDNVCKFYTLLYEEKTIIIVQIEKSKSFKNSLKLFCVNGLCKA